MNGTVTGWGLNDYGQALNGNFLTGVLDVRTGPAHSLALLANGRITGWGYNHLGQALGGNSLTGVIKISAGTDHS